MAVGSGVKSAPNGKSFRYELGLKYLMTKALLTVILPFRLTHEPRLWFMGFLNFQTPTHKRESHKRQAQLSYHNAQAT